MNMVSCTEVTIVAALVGTMGLVGYSVYDKHMSKKEPVKVQEVKKQKTIDDKMYIVDDFKIPRIEHRTCMSYHTRNTNTDTIQKYWVKPLDVENAGKRLRLLYLIPPKKEVIRPGLARITYNPLKTDEIHRSKFINKYANLKKDQQVYSLSLNCWCSDNKVKNKCFSMKADGVIKDIKYNY